MAKGQEKKQEALGKFRNISLNKLVMADWNYKKFDDPEMHKKLVENIKKNGQIENIIVRSIGEGQYEIVNGNHRFLAMKDAGLTVAVCYDLGKISLAKAKRIAVETNETKFGTDDEKLSALLGDIVIEEEDFALTNPFSEDQMKEFNSIGLDEGDDKEDVTPSPKKTTKTKTAHSLAGEKYTTVKIEAIPEEADEFTSLIQRFNKENNPAGNSLGIICKFMGQFSDDEILKKVGILGTVKKGAKKPLKARA